MKNVSLLFFALFFSGICFAQDSITLNDVRSAEKIISLHFSDSKNDSLLEEVQSRAKVYDKMHLYSLDNSIPMSMAQSPLLPYMNLNKKQLPVKFDIPAGVNLPANRNDLAFYSIPQLASLIKNKKITSAELTQFFIDRLKKFDDTLHCVISFTTDIAMAEAKKADEEIAAGRYRGLLHGIPYGLKDLFAVRGTKTTWGAEPYKDQEIDNNSYVYTKLKEAGAVLIAKLSLGALAMDDYWFGGQNKKPMEYAGRIQWLFCGLCVSYRGRACSICHWNRNVRFYYFTIHRLRSHRFTPHIRLNQQIRRHDTLLEFG